jgi:Glycine zipper 2TM domain
MPTRRPFRALSALAVALPALALPAMAQAQNYADLPPLSPMSEAEVRSLPAEYRTAPVMTQTAETIVGPDGVETITRTRRIDAARPLPAGPSHAPHGYAPPHVYAPAPAYAAPAYAPVVFERQQWIDECRRRTAGRDKDDTGLIIGGLLGAIAGGFAGYEIAGAGDRVLGTVLGVGGGGLIGGLIGSLFDGDDDEDRYDCEAALDSYLSHYGAPGGHVASRTIAYPAQGYSHGYGYPAGYSYGYTYAPPPQVVLVEVRTEVQQQVVVRETERYETYTVPGAARVIPDPAPRPSPKMIKGGR